MTPRDVTVWLTIGAALMGAGIWIGRLDARVLHMESALARLLFPG